MQHKIYNVWMAVVALKLLCTESHIITLYINAYLFILCNYVIHLRFPGLIQESSD
jgi:hypothetical protein